MLQLTRATYIGRYDTTSPEQHTKEDITLPTYYSQATTNGFFLFFGAPVAKYDWIIKKIGRHPQQTIIFDICSVFLKILIFVALTRDFHVGRVRPAADLRATSHP